MHNRYRTRITAPLTLHPFARPWGLVSLGLAALALGMLSEPAKAQPQAPLQPVAVAARPLLQTSTTWAGQPIQYPAGPAEVTALEITLAPGAETGWHSHPVASFAYILQGTLEVTLRDGRSQRVGQGQALAEVVGLEHNGRNVGTGPVRLVVFYTGTQGMALSRAAEATAPEAKPAP